MAAVTALEKTDTIDARELDFDSIPVIDIGPLFHDDEKGQQRVANEIGEACRHTGFFYVTNHGIDQDVVDELVGQTKRFFHLPLEQKMDVDVMKTQRHRGYVPNGALYADVNKKPDLQEGYEVSMELPDDDPHYLDGNIMLGPNVWPEKLPGFREGVYTYYEAVHALGRKMFNAFERTLGLPQGWFDDKIDKPMGQLRLIYYPSQEGPIDADQIGIGAHTDYECFTLLLQDDVGGLQVGNRAGEWIKATPIPGAIVINIGDMLMRWTNGEFVSTPHRVINDSGRERVSFPFFFGANYDTVVRPLPQFTSDDKPAQFPPTMCGPWTETQITDVYEYRVAYRGKVPNPELPWDAPE
ncbi:MAG: 2OG-Fe(II) oxygenase [Rhodospirillaceae bacterium]|nr:2OG-Fe(II) oxygenase [Rhodospirillaceae bacterium]|tara:strand:- start:22323 stop:23384 length:1062 start_codon:yes stop_codon:yes gene_type:complete